MRDRSARKRLARVRVESGTAVADTDLHHVIMFFGRKFRSYRQVDCTVPAFSTRFCTVSAIISWSPLIGRKFQEYWFYLKIIPSAEDSGIFQTSFEQFAQVELGRAQGQATGVSA